MKWREAPLQYTKRIWGKGYETIKPNTTLLLIIVLRCHYVNLTTFEN